MTHYLIAFLFFSFAGYANELNIMAKETDYVEGRLLLEQEVLLKHTPFGNLSADRALLDPSDKGGFTKAILEGQVLLDQKQAKVRCDRIEIEGLTGKLSSKGGRISYEDSSVPFSFKGDDLHLVMRKEGEAYLVDNFIGDGNIHLEFTKDFVVRAKKIQYEKDGILNTSNECTLLRDTHELSAKSLSFDTKKHQLQGCQVNGSLGNICDYLADSLNWNTSDHTLSLKGRVSLHEYGQDMKITSDNIEISLTDGQEISKIVCLDGSTISSKNTQIVCNGTTEWDYENDVLHARVHMPAHRLSFSSGDLCIFANESECRLNKDGSSFASISFNGDVQININAEKSSSSSLADHAVFDPSQGRLTLTSFPKKKVCLLRDQNQTKLRADQIVINRDGTIETKGEVAFFVGLGDTKEYLEDFMCKGS